MREDFEHSRGPVVTRAWRHLRKLSVYAVTGRRLLLMIWFAMRAVVGKVDRRTDFVALGECDATVVHAHAGSVEIALDGETSRMASPLKFKTLAKALKIVVPACDRFPG